MPCVTSLRTPERGKGSGDDNDVCSLVRRTSGLLVVRIRVIVVTGVCDGSSGSCLWELGNDDGDSGTPDFLTG